MEKVSSPFYTFSGRMCYSFVIMWLLEGIVCVNVYNLLSVFLYQ